MKKLFLVLFLLLPSLCFADAGFIGLVGSGEGGGDTCSDTHEDLSGYTLVDGQGSKITLGTPDDCGLSWTNLNNSTTASYAYVDKGAGHFSGDFTHRFTTEMTDETGGSEVILWGVSNDLDQGNAWTDGVYIKIYIGSRLWIQNVTDSTYDQWVGFTEDVVYYITVEYDDTANTLTAVVRTGSHTGTTVDTMAASFTTEESFQYLYGVASLSEGGAGDVTTGYVKNLEIVE